MIMAIRKMYCCSLAFLRKLNIVLPCDPAVGAPQHLPNELENYVHRKTCTQEFKEALCLVTKTGKHVFQ